MRHLAGDESARLIGGHRPPASAGKIIAPAVTVPNTKTRSML